MRRALTIATHLLGVVAFLYPFAGARHASGVETSSHATDAPLLFAAFSALLIAIAVTELRAGRMDAKQIAALGVLAGINAVLRLPGAFSGASLMFVLPILCGYAFGARFGFLLGASSMAASALLTGGVGPWLPFQMWGLGWVGGGASMIRHVQRPRLAVASLAAYGWISGLLFGALLNLWFWPFQGGNTDVSWSPGLSAGQALAHYWRFYLLTSLAWDSARAIINAVLIATIGRPVIALLVRFRARLSATWQSVEPASALASPHE